VLVYNEAATIGELLARVDALDLDKQIVVVDDGSTDGTGAVLDDWQDRDNVVVIRKENGGKGSAMSRTAVPRPGDRRDPGRRPRVRPVGGSDLDRADLPRCRGRGFRLA
jgi:GT2 family glycosyltransferase